MDLAVIASFWMGNRLSYLEQLCLKSFVNLGHRVILYSYTGLENCPNGIEVEDARQILPEHEFLNFVGKPHPAAAVFSDKFRVHLMLKTNVTWVDCDMFALKAFEQRDYLLPLEFSFQLSNAVLKLPPKSKALQAYAQFLDTPYPKFPEDWSSNPEVMAEARNANEKNLHILDLKFYHWGPFGLTYFTKKSGEISHALPGHMFFPISGWRTQQSLRPSAKFMKNIPADCCAIHFYSSMVKPKLQNRYPDGNLPQNSYLFEQCQLHGIDPAQSPI